MFRLQQLLQVIALSLCVTAAMASQAAGDAVADKPTQARPTPGYLLLVLDTANQDRTSLELIKNLRTEAVVYIDKQELAGPQLPMQLRVTYTQDFKQGFAVDGLQPLPGFQSQPLRF